jgi:hypothetical protein
MVYSKAAPRRCFLRLTDIATGKIRRTAQYQYSVKMGGGPVAYQDDVLWIGLPQNFLHDCGIAPNTRSYLGNIMGSTRNVFAILLLRPRC